MPHHLPRAGHQPGAGVVLQRGVFDGPVFPGIVVDDALVLRRDEVLHGQAADDDVLGLLGERGQVDPLPVEHRAGRAEVDVPVFRDDLAERIRRERVRSRREPESGAGRRILRFVVQVGGNGGVDYHGPGGRGGVGDRLVVAHRPRRRRLRRGGGGGGINRTASTAAAKTGPMRDMRTNLRSVPGNEHRPPVLTSPLSSVRSDGIRRDQFTSIRQGQVKCRGNRPEFPRWAGCRTPVWGKMRWRRASGNFPEEILAGLSDRAGGVRGRGEAAHEGRRRGEEPPP